MKPIVREKIGHAIHSLSTREAKFIAWASKVEDLKGFHSFSIKNFGLVSVPITESSIDRLLTDFTTDGTIQKLKPLIVDYSQVEECAQTSLKQSFREFVDFAIPRAFDIPLDDFELCLEAKLDKLIVLSPEEEYHGPFNVEKEKGTFGTMLVQIPVQGITAGGLFLKAEYGSRSTCFVLTEHCESSFHVAIVAGQYYNQKKQGFTLKAAKSSPCAVMALNLIWKNQASQPKIRPDYLPDVLQAAYEMNLALCEAQGSVYSIPLTCDNYCRGQLYSNSLVSQDATIVHVLRSVKDINAEIALVLAPANENEEASSQLAVTERIPLTAFPSIPSFFTSIEKCNVFGNLESKLMFCDNFCESDYGSCGLKREPLKDYFAVLIFSRKLSHADTFRQLKNHLLAAATKIKQAKEGILPDKDSKLKIADELKRAIQTFKSCCIDVGVMFLTK